MPFAALAEVLGLFGIQVGTPHVLVGVALRVFESVAEPAFVDGDREELGLDG